MARANSLLFYERSFMSGALVFSGDVRCLPRGQNLDPTVFDTVQFVVEDLLEQI